MQTNNWINLAHVNYFNFSSFLKYLSFNSWSQAQQKSCQLKWCKNNRSSIMIEVTRIINRDIDLRSHRTALPETTLFKSFCRGCLTDINVFEENRGFLHSILPPYMVALFLFSFSFSDGVLLNINVCQCEKSMHGSLHGLTNSCVRLIQMKSFFTSFAIWHKQWLRLAKTEVMDSEREDDCSGLFLRWSTTICFDWGLVLFKLFLEMVW